MGIHDKAPDFDTFYPFPEGSIDIIDECYEPSEILCDLEVDVLVGGDGYDGGVGDNDPKNSYLEIVVWYRDDHKSRPISDFIKKLQINDAGANSTIISLEKLKLFIDEKISDIKDSIR